MSYFVNTYRHSAHWIGLTSLILCCGCQSLQTPSSSQLVCDQSANCDESDQAWIPRELDKVTLPIYRVAPPDVLTIDVVPGVTHSTYRLQVGEMVALSVKGTFPDEPIEGDYLIDAGGFVDLGYSYGAFEIAGRTIDEAITLIEGQLLAQLRDPRVSLSLRSPSNVQPIYGEHLVGADGTITLGQHGTISVVGMTLEEVRSAIANHLSGVFANPQVSVSVYAFNSKVYYIVTQGGGLGDSLVRLPYTGGETVMDALSQVNGLSYVSSSRIWIARPDRDSKTSQILPVDWEGMSQRAEVETNYQMMPGDRLYIAHCKLAALDSAIAKLTSPFERIFGFTLLGTATASRLSGKVLDNSRYSITTTGR